MVKKKKRPISPSHLLHNQTEETETATHVRPDHHFPTQFIRSEMVAFRDAKFGERGWVVSASEFKSEDPGFDPLVGSVRGAVFLCLGVNSCADLFVRCCFFVHLWSTFVRLLWVFWSRFGVLGLKRSRCYYYYQYRYYIIIIYYKACKERYAHPTYLGEIPRYKNQHLN